MAGAKESSDAISFFAQAALKWKIIHLVAAVLQESISLLARGTEVRKWISTLLVALDQTGYAR